MSSLSSASVPTQPRSVRVAGLAVLSLGLALLALWLVSPELASLSMKTNTAVGVALLGASLALIRTPRASLALALGAAGIGLATLFEYAADVDLGIDTLVASDPDPMGEAAPHPNRMAPNAALGLLLVAAARAASWSRRERWVALGQAVALGSLAISLVALIGYLYEVRELYRPTSFIRISPFTAAALVFASIAVLAARPDIGVSRLLARAHGDTRAVQWMLAASVLVPIVLGWLRLEGQRHGLYGTALGTSLLVVSMTATMTMMVLGLAASLDRIDRERALAESGVRVAAELASALSRAATTREVSEATVRIGKQLLGPYGAVVALASEDGTRLRVVCAEGYPKDVLERFADIPTTLEVPAAVAWRDRSPLYVSQRSEWARRFPGAVGLSLPREGAWAALPLLGRDVDHGVLAFSFASRQDFAKVSREALETVARQCAQALDRASLFDSVRSAQHEVSVASERLRAVLQAAAIGTYVHHGDDRIELDEGARRLFGLEPSSGPVTLSELTARIDGQGASELRRALDRCAAESASFELLYRVRGEDARWVRQTGTAVLDARGGALQVRGALVDVTDERRAREHAEDASRAKDELLAMLGHELRNPLAPIFTALALMDVSPEHGARARAVIERQARHMVQLVDDLLDGSRIARGKIEIERARVDVAELVARSIELSSPLLESRRHHLDVVVEDGLTVRGDARRLTQSLSNLLTNAAKYTDPGGHVAVRARRVGDEVVISVRDDGTGIAPEVLPRVFELFVQGERRTEDAKGGLGLGLAIVRSLVELHGGRVVAESAGRGHGSTFSIHLPRDEGGEAEPARSETSRSGVVVIARRILVVDDNEDAAEMLAAALRVEGHEVCVAHDGPSALAIAATLRPEVAFLDLDLPVMDGYEIAQRLVALAPTRPPRLVAVTGLAHASEVARTHAAGFERHLVKPVDLAVVRAFARGDGARARERRV